MLIDRPEDFHLVLEAASLERSHSWFVCDLETTGLKPFHGDRLIGIAISFVEKDFSGIHSSFYLPFRHDVPGERNLPYEFLRRLFFIFTDPDRTWFNQHTKFDMHTLSQEGVHIYNQHADLMQIAHLNNENFPSYSLDFISKIYLGPDQGGKHEDKMVEWAKEHLGCLSISDVKSRMKFIPPRIVAEYAEYDCQVAWDTFKEIIKRLNQKGISHLVPGVSEYGGILRNMENRGALVDVPLCEKSLDHAQSNKERCKQELAELTGIPEFNPNSPKQMREYMLGTLNMPIVKYTNGGKSGKQQASFDSDAIELLRIEHNHPSFDLIEECREWQVQEANYFRKFLQMLTEHDRIHCYISSTGTVSSRLSVREPPLQGLPRETERYAVRDVIKARRGYKIISIDFSQIELRLGAFYTQDKNLLDAFKGGIDLHTRTAQATGLPRDHAPGAKTLNFASFYGLGIEGIMRKFRRSLAEATKLHEDFHREYAGIRRLQNHMQRLAKRQGFIELWTGRRRNYGSEGETHKAMSNLIQGGVAELMRVAITKIEHASMGTRLGQFLQVHDDILFECPEEEVDFWVPICVGIMQDFNFSIDNDPATYVPIIAEPKIGDNWGQLSKWKPPIKPVDPLAVEADDLFDLMTQIEEAQHLGNTAVVL